MVDEGASKVPPAPPQPPPPPSLWWSEEEGRVRTSAILALFVSGLFGLLILFCSGVGAVFAFGQKPGDAGGPAIFVGMCMLVLLGIGCVSAGFSLANYWRRLFLAVTLAAAGALLGLFLLLGIGRP
ncbi:MAG TPA: hypothetical protein VGN57_11845 [Pirellulaceae bacterium]|jgi:hypothetical protein|nr:hypothetical protein [Pirellulaceae bacterium]